MRMYRIAPVIALTALFFTMCSVDPDGTSIPDLVASWKANVPKLNENTQVINLNISVDSTYDLEMVENESKILFAHYGVWNVNSLNDSLHLNGDTCQVLDTTTNSLINYPTLCDSAIAVLLNFPNDSTWKINMSQFGTLISTLPMDSASKELAKLLTLTFTKQ